MLALALSDGLLPVNFQLQKKKFLKVEINFLLLELEKMKLSEYTMSDNLPNPERLPG